MPKVNPLTGNGKSAATAPVATPPKTPPVTPPSTPPNGSNAPATFNSINAENVGAIAKSMNVPAWLQQDNSLPETSDREFGGFIGFASTFSEKWIEQTQAGLRDGQPYLYHERSYIPLEKLEFFLLQGQGFQTLMVGKAGAFKFATRDMSLSSDEMPREGQNYAQPHYVMLMIVHVNGQLIPIKGDFRGTKSGGIESAIRAVEAAATPEWAQLSDKHKVACQFPQPFGRVFVTSTTSRQVSKTTGNPYYRLDASPAPSSIAQLQLLINAFQNEDFQNALTEAKTNYEARVKFMDELCAKSIANAAAAASRAS